MSIRWNLQNMMRARDISSLAELQRMLEHAGCRVSLAQLSRISREKPERLNMRLLESLLEVLDCGVGELLVDERSSAKQSRRKPGQRHSAPVGQAALEEFSFDFDPVVGPEVVPFPREMV